MPSRRELVAHNRTEEEISQYIGADLVIFQTLEDLVSACRQFNPAIGQFDCSVFTGEYVTGGVDEAYLAGLENLRSDNAKLKANAWNRPAVVNVNGANTGSSNEAAVQETGGDSVVSASGPMNEMHQESGVDNTQNVGLSNAGEVAMRDQPDLVPGLSNS